MTTLTLSTQAIIQLREQHHLVEKFRCGARKTELVTHYHENTTETNLVCTQDVGHEGSHKDAICCWRFHKFTDAEPQPEDVWRGEGCSCGRLGCETRAILDANLL